MTVLLPVLTFVFFLSLFYLVYMGSQLEYQSKEYHPLLPLNNWKDVWNDDLLPFEKHKQYK